VSEQNVAIAKRAWEASLRHDNEMALSFYDPEVVLEAGNLDTPAVYRGLDGVREWWRSGLSAFSDLQASVEEWIDAGDNVIAILRLTGRGRRSGVPVERHEAHVWTVRDGKLWRLRVYKSRAKALTAVGWRSDGEESTTPDLGGLTRLAFVLLDRGDLDGFLCMCAPDAVWEMTDLGTRIEGLAALRRFYEEWMGAYEDFEFEVEEVLVLENGVVFAVNVAKGRLVGSAVDVPMRTGTVGVWEGGVVAQGYVLRRHR